MLKKGLLALGIGLLARIASAIPCNSSTPPSLTTRAGFSEPVINACNWGATLNTNFTILDASMCIQGAVNIFSSTNTFTQPVIIQPNQAFRLYDASTHYIQFTASNVVTTTSFVWPPGDGTNGQGLLTDGAGHLSFGTVSGGGGSGNVTNSPQFQLPFYSAVGITNILTGDPSIVTDGAGNMTLNGLTAATLVDSPNGYKQSGSLVLNYSAGTHNLLLGANALGSITSGATNLGIGNNALSQTTSGSNNTAVGQSALNSNVTGPNNTAIGANAGVTNTTGQQNTFIGVSADANSNNLTNTTAIGYNAKVSTSNTVQLGQAGTGIIAQADNMAATSFVGTGPGAGQIFLRFDSTNTVTQSAGNVVIWADSVTLKPMYNPNATSSFTIVGTSNPVTVGHCAQFSDKAGAVVDAGASCGTGGGSSPGAPVNSVQYNSGGSLAGSSAFQFNGTSVTAVSSFTITNGGGNGGNGGIGGAGILDIWLGTLSATNQTYFSMGSPNLADQVVCRDNIACLFQRGLQTADFNIDNVAHVIQDRTASNNQVNFYDTTTGDLAVKTNNGSLQSDILLQPRLVTTVIISSSNGTEFISSATARGNFGIIGKNGLAVTYGVNVGSFTGAGLTTCGSGTQALSWSGTTNLFGCQTLSGGGGNGTSVYAATATASFPFGESASTLTVTGSESVSTNLSSYTVANPVLVDSSTASGDISHPQMTLMNENVGAGHWYELLGFGTGGIGFGYHYGNSPARFVWQNGSTVLAGLSVSAPLSANQAVCVDNNLDFSTTCSIGAQSLVSTVTYKTVDNNWSHAQTSISSFTVAGLNLVSNPINSVTDPTNAQDAATKNYVDNSILGVDYKAPARLATTAALPSNVYANGSSGVGATLTGVSFGALNIDNTTPIVGDRVLINNEGTTANNGIYTVTTVGAVATLYVLTRAADYNQTSEVQAGDAVFVTSGSVNNGTGWVQTTSGTITIGASPISFVQFTGLGDVKAGYGISTTGNTINLRSDTTSYIQNSNIAVAGSTASVSFLYASSSASILGPIVASSGTFTGQIIAGNLSSTSTITGNFFAKNGIYLSTATATGTAGIVNANYTTNCYDSVILSSGLSHVGNLITLGPAANCPNQVLQIIKVNASVDVTTVVVTAGDLIDGATGTFILNTVGQSGELISGGSSGWWEHGRGIQITPNYLTSFESDAAAFSMTAASDTIICPFYNPIPTTIIGFRLVIQATGGDSNTARINFGIYDNARNLIFSTGPITVSGTGIQTKLNNPFILPPGQYYFGQQHSNAAMNTNGLSAASAAHAFCSRQTATSMTLPNPFTPGTIISKGSATRILTFGGFSSE